MQNNLRQLRASGYVKIQAGGGRNNCNLYLLNVDKLASQTPHEVRPFHQETPQHMPPLPEETPHFVTETPHQMPRLDEETPHEMHPLETETPHLIPETPHFVTINPAPDAPKPSLTIIEPLLEDKSSLSSGDDDPIKTSVDEYNKAAKESGWPQIRVLNKSRKAALAARLRECGGIDGWRAALEKAQASDFLCGRSTSGWIVSFDFLIRQSSFAKLMEGNYDNRTHNARPQQSRTHGIGSDTSRAIANVAAKYANASAAQGN